MKQSKEMEEVKEKLETMIYNLGSSYYMEDIHDYISQNFIPRSEAIHKIGEVEELIKMEFENWQTAVKNYNKLTSLLKK